jgi:ribosome maturation factor RimP
VGNDQTRDRLVEVLTGPLLAVGVDLEAVDVTPAGRRRVLRVAVDKDGGVTLDDVADATREVSRVLDDSDVMGEQPYTLEVTSRGVDRPLTLPRHWRRNITRLVAVNGLTGRVLDVDESGIVLDVDGTPRALRFDELGPGKVQIEFKRMDEADFGDEEEDDVDDEGEGEE